MADKSSSRIAIKFGGPASSAKPKKASRPEPPSGLGKHPRTFGADSDDEDEEGLNTGRHEAISGFGEDGAELDFVPNKSTSAGKPLEPVQDASQQNPSPKNASPGEPSTMEEDRPIQWGLNIAKPCTAVTNQMADEPLEDAVRHRHQDEETEGKEALDSIPEKSNQSSLKSTAKESWQSYAKGTTKPQAEVSSLKDYDDIPVEGFGAALLRGMGWNGENRGKVRDNKRRENHLGLGATKLKEAEDLGAWGQGKKRPRLNEYQRDEEKRKEAREDRYRERDDRARSQRQSSYRTGDSDQDQNSSRGDRRDRNRHRDQRDRDLNKERERGYREHGRDRDRDWDGHRDRHSRR